MKIMESSVELFQPIDGQEILKHIEKCGRICYKSEDKICDGSAEKFVSNIVKRGHLAVLDHVSFSVKFICDRACANEIVRHRLAGYCQESTRYVDSTKYRGEVNDKYDVVRLYKLGLTAKEISKLGPKFYTQDSIYSILHREGISKEDQVDYSYFDVINSSRKAYLLGLIQSDGNVRKREENSFVLTISQNMNEMWYIEALLKEEIGYRINAVSGGRENQQSVSVVNSHLVNSLYKLGIIPNKTKEQTETDVNILWNSIPSEYKWDFIHGLFDGDGCIIFGHQMTSAGNPSGASYDIAGNFYLLNLIKDFIEKELPGIHIAVDDHKTYGRLRISHTGYIKELCKKMLANLEIPFTNPHKTIRILSNVKDIPYKEVEFGNPSFIVIRPNLNNCDPSCEAYWIWLHAMYELEKSYTKLRLDGIHPQEARSVLPNCLKTELVMTADLREWRHFLTLRSSKAAHPQIRELSLKLLKILQENIPIIFDDIEGEE